ncbi:YbfA family protein [Edwardsiella piscicida]|uniref:YbfA family protein n=1 Tax=Edwardsiella piscicida TaxID=1263550 RepID=UPI001CF4ABF1|nr:YbfA family protein [Edwardsiella piscicida]UCQ56771.1 YbfA family protein [Edwardsiella piscicida]
MYQRYSWPRIWLRRAGVILVGTLAFPVMLLRHDRARFYSYLHRVWSKTSDKPVWLAESEKVRPDFF